MNTSEPSPAITKASTSLRTTLPLCVTRIPLDHILTESCWKLFCHADKTACASPSDAVIFSSLVDHHGLVNAILMSMQLEHKFRPALDALLDYIQEEISKNYSLLSDNTKHRFNPEFVDSRNNAANVVAEDFA